MGMIFHRLRSMMRTRSLCEGTAANGEQFGFTSVIYFKVNASEEYGRYSIDRYIRYIDDYRSQYGRIQMRHYNQAVVYMWLFDDKIIFDKYIFGVIIAIVVFASVCSTYVYCLLNTISLEGTCQQYYMQRASSKADCALECFVSLAIHRLT